MSKDATKIEIAKAVEEIFGVKVIKVNTLNVTGKLKRTGRYPAGRRPSWKKAVVTLSDDSKSIESSKEWLKEVNALWLLRATSPQRLPAVT